MIELQEKINPDLAYGLLFGVAIGDTLGGALEFMTAEEIHQKYDEVREILGGGWLNLQKGEITDDTQMTIAVAEGILENPNNPVPAVGEKFKNWLASKPKDVGCTCESVIRGATEHHSSEKEEWFARSKQYDVDSGGESAGNGSLMRMAYPSLYYPIETAISHAVDLGKMTHWHEHSTLSITCYTKVLTKLLRMKNTVDLATGQALLEEEMKPVREIGKKQGKNENPPPTGYVIDSLLCALNCIRDTDNFEDALVKAVNLGGDSDTIGAITGSLAGSIYGKTAIPERWLSVLDKEIAEKLDGLVKLALER